jgi:hypothetical protein
MFPNRDFSMGYERFKQEKLLPLHSGCISLLKTGSIIGLRGAAQRS